MLIREKKSLELCKNQFSRCFKNKLVAQEICNIQFLLYQRLSSLLSFRRKTVKQTTTCSHFEWLSLFDMREDIICHSFDLNPEKRLKKQTPDTAIESHLRHDNDGIA